MVEQLREIFLEYYRGQLQVEALPARCNAKYSWTVIQDYSKNSDSTHNNTEEEHQYHRVIDLTFPKLLMADAISSRGLIDIERKKSRQDYSFSFYLSTILSGLSILASSTDPRM